MKRIALYFILFSVISTNPICISSVEQAKSHRTDSYWNDAARYLAGMEIKRSSILWEKTQEPEYRKHSRFMESLWKRIQKETIDLIIPWRGKNIPAATENTTAFYPLSGADFINLYTMFPTSRTYIMIAMEQPGNIAALCDYRSRRLINGLAPIRRSIYLYGVNNYFQSKIMIREMNNTYLPGTAPVLLIFMARLGLTIEGVENIYISESGSIITAPAKPERGLGAQISGVRIYFKCKGNNKLRELVYLSMKLMPDSISPVVPCGRFLDRLNDVYTLLKSAVYILHEKKYEPVRNFVLQRSAVIVQDDSGIPFSAFGREWSISLYGVYRPYLALSGCRPVRQYDLEKEYRKKSLPLPFNFGYGILYGKRKSNLMVARKKIWHGIAI